jgi:hypothetical protein
MREIGNPLAEEFFSLTKGEEARAGMKNKEFLFFNNKNSKKLGELLMNMKKMCGVLTCLALTLLMASCSDQPQEQSVPAHTSTQRQNLAGPATIGKQPGEILSGKVLETFNSGGYTYVLVDSDLGKKWAAAAETPVSVGDDVSIPGGSVMKNFYSKSLDRTFEEIIFAAGIAGKSPKGTGMGEGGTSSSEAFQGVTGSHMGETVDPAAASLGSGKAVVPFSELKIEKASGENTFTVGELYEKSADLNGKKVVVKAQVMKVTPNIMGKNWLHLQDGTGDPTQNTHDLVVTSPDIPEQGEIITVEGVLSADKDFGFGYKYAVIVEDVAINR